MIDPSLRLSSTYSHQMVATQNGFVKSGREIQGKKGQRWVLGAALPIAYYDS